MKICPKCQKQYPNGFQYCPADTELLLSNDEFARQPKSVVSKKQDDPFLTQTDLYPVTPSSHGDQVQADQARVEQLLAEQLKAEQQRIGRKRETKPTPPVEAEQVTQPLNQSQSGYSTEAFQSAPPQKPKYQADHAEQQAGYTERVEKPDRPDRNDRSERANTGNGFRTPSVASAAGNEYTGSLAPSASSGTPMASSISFSIPEQSSVFSNILSGLKNLGSIFSNRGATGGQGFTFLLTEETLTTRIARVTSNAVAEFSKDPKQFTVTLVKGEGSNLQRRNALIGGFEMAVAGFMTVFFSAMALRLLPNAATRNVKIIILGLVSFLVVCYVFRGLLLFNFANTKKKLFAIPKISLEVLNWAPILALLILIIRGFGGYDFYCSVFPEKCVPPPIAKTEELRLLSVVEPEKIDLDKLIKKSPKKTEKANTGGSKAKPKAASGGGGGGRQEQTPPTKGVPPPMSLAPQIIPPNPNPPKITNPTLVVRQTIYGDPKALPPLKGPIGDPTAPPAPGPPSSGPGKGAGIGRGSGTGVGGGEGGGLGAGRGGNTGGGDMGIGGGVYSSREVDARPQILYKEKAKFTEEARQNKIQGAVVLSLIFGANGTISNIRVVRGLPNGLSENAIAAAQKIRFTPAIKNGKPVSMRQNVEFNFNLY